MRHTPKENAVKCRYCSFYVLQMCNMERHEVIHPEYVPDPNNKTNFELSKMYKKKLSKKVNTNKDQPTMGQNNHGGAIHIQQQTIVQLNHDPHIDSVQQEITIRDEPTFRNENQSASLAIGQDLLNSFLQQEQPAFNELNLNRFEYVIFYF